MPLKIAECLTEMSHLNVEKGNLNGALHYMTEALSIEKKINGENHINVAINYKHVSAILLQMGAIEQARHFIARSLMIFTLLPVSAPIEYASAFEMLGCVYLKTSNPLLAIKYFKKTTKIRKMHVHEDQFQIGMVYYRLGQAYVFLQRLDLAMQYYQKALVIGAERYLIYRDLGDISCMQNKSEEAFKYYEKALSDAKLKYGDNHVEIAKLYERIADMYCLREEYKLAAEYFMKILDYYENHVPNQARLIAKYSIYVARAHNDVDQHTTAINYFERALKNLPENDSQVLKTRWEIAGSYKLLADKCNKESDFLKALEYYEHALGILRQWFPSEVDAIEITESLAKQTRQVMGSNE